jgi:hypothetical protein
MQTDTPTSDDVIQIGYMDYAFSSYVIVGAVNGCKFSEYISSGNGSSSSG